MNEKRKMQSGRRAADSRGFLPRGRARTGVSPSARGSPVLSTELFPAGVTPRETIFCHLLPFACGPAGSRLSRKLGCG